MRGNKWQPGLISMGNHRFTTVYLAYLSWKIFRRSWTQQERRDNQGLISTGNHRFTLPGLSQWEKIRRSWTQWERGDNQGLISTGSISSSTRSLSLNRKEGTTRDSFQREISAENESYISMGNYKFTSVKLEVGVSGFMDILISNTYSARPLSLSTGKKGQPGAHFNGKSQVYNTWLISVGKYQKKLNSMGKKG